MKPHMILDMPPRTLLIAAGGTGGHIVPGLTVATVMRERGWRVRWLGHPDCMEGELVPAQGFELLPLRFAGLRGKGWLAWLKLPFTLFGACRQARKALKQCRPDMVLGMGGYVAFPAGLMAKWSGIPLVIHEQNAVAGSANRWLAKLARTVLAGFPGSLPGAQVVGNPVSSTFAHQPAPAQRYRARGGPLRLLVLGGSLGAQALNTVVPQALAHLPAQARPEVRHQCGRNHLDATRTAYQTAGIVARCEPFIDHMVDALTWADVVVCRAGAMTVTEVSAIGVAALFVPLPHAIDDHQRVNARFLSECGSAWMQEQKNFTPQWLAQWLAQRTRPELMQTAQRARQHARPQAAQHIADACERAANKTTSSPPTSLPPGGKGMSPVKDAA